MMEKKVLILTLNKKWFYLMFSGMKKTEYRKPSKWMKSRLFNKDGSLKEYTHVKFINGYGKDKPYFEAVYFGFTEALSNFKWKYGTEVVNVEKDDFMIYFGKTTETNVEQKEN